jgi:hypothetical protein
LKTFRDLCCEWDELLAAAGLCGGRVFILRGRVTSSNIVQYILLENVLAKLMIKMEIDYAVVGQSMVRKLPSKGQREYGTYGRKYFDIRIIFSQSL